jgi:hypothetical protein
MNKRGQEGFKLVNLILALVVLVVIAGGIWYFTSKAQSAATNIPGNAEVISQACSLVASEQTKTSYCTQLREIRTDEYITCDGAKDYGISITDADSMKSICAGETNNLKKVVESACNNEFKDKKSTKINGKICSSGGWDIEELKPCDTINNEDLCDAESNCIWLVNEDICMSS